MAVRRVQVDNQHRNAIEPAKALRLNVRPTLLGGIEETSASFEARSAPRPYLTPTSGTRTY